jgi:hypothetical protein
MVSLSIRGMTGWVNPFFLAARRPWTFSVAWRRSAGAFFVGTPALVRHPFWLIIQRKPLSLDCPIGGFKQAPKAPRRDGGWRPRGHLFQRLAPGRDGLHKDEPAEYETMATAPYRGHAAKDHGDKARQIGEGDQHVQSPLQRREREKSCQWQFSCRLYTFCH